MKAPAAAFVVGLLTLAAFGGRLSSQAPPRVDFERDVRPLLQERCVGCHGPSQQQGGYRLDRRSGAFGGVLRHNIIPGSSESSRVYRRLLGPQAGGPQMPPTGALPPEQIDIIKRWIDEGAMWPEALANEVDAPAVSPAATEVTELIRAADRKAALAYLANRPAIMNERGTGGATPLMSAVLYGDASLVAEMLRHGGDPNLRNDAGATSVMWALDDVEKVRVLLDRGADVNATSNFGRTPLQLAIPLQRSTPVVKLLLERGATASADALRIAAVLGNVEVVRLLIAAGATDTGAAAIAAIRSGCHECFAAIAGGKLVPPLRGAVLGVLPPLGPGRADRLQEAVARGGDVNAKDGKSRTALMLAAISETLPPESLQLLIDRGADVHVKNPDGRTALDFAKRLGQTPVVDVLTKAGATSASEPSAPSTFVNGNTARDAIQRSVPLLQRSGLEFYRKSGCLSCHSNTMTAMTVAAVRSKGLAVDEASARHDLARIVDDVRATRDQALQGIFAPGGAATTAGYILIGLSAEAHPPDSATDALVRALRLSQRADGLWTTGHRPPAEASEITATAVSVRGVQLYGRVQERARNAQVVQAARAALERAAPLNTEDRVFRVFGLTWASASPDVRQAAIRDLLATQRADGGWAQISSLQSDAYATGSALVALHEAGVRPDDAAYRRGVQFLLTTQLADGSWFVRTRSHPTQIYFESGFPHGEHQYISAAATNWATLALAHVYEPKTRSAR